MDNLSAHKGKRVRELVEHMGRKLLYLPPYWPDLNPIEEDFSKIKGFPCEKNRGQHPRSPGRGDGSSALGG
jgi:transposase